MPTYNNSGFPESKPHSVYKNVLWIILKTVQNYAMLKATSHSSIFNIPMHPLREDQKHRDRFTR